MYQVAIENPSGILLPDSARTLLERIFADYERVVIRAEFGGGFGGGRVLLVRPIHRTGPELPAVIKMGPATIIDQEWEAYRACIQHRLPGVARIENQPAYLADGTLAALRYPLVGEGAFNIESLRQFSRRADSEKILYVLEKRLFASMKLSWSNHEAFPDFLLRASYDPLLPVNYLIACKELPPDTSPIQLTPATISVRQFAQGESVQLVGFEVVEVDRQKGEVTLNLPQMNNARTLPTSYRLRLTAVPDISSYRVGNSLDTPVTGVITATRYDQLIAQAQKAVGYNLDLKAERLPLPGGASLPNPLVFLPNILNLSLDVRVACIHGDLNLENILVEHDGRSMTVQLIDFAGARRDHVLHDLLRLEASFILGLLPEVLAQAYLGPTIIHPFYERLHCAVQLSRPVTPPTGLEKPFAILLAARQMAGAYLYDPKDWSEYYHGLTLYLLGALKFKNLDRDPTAPLPKQLAFWGAAAAQHLAGAQPACEQMAAGGEPAEGTAVSFGKPMGVGAYPEESSSGGIPLQNQTDIRGPISGPVHTGSGNINIYHLPATKDADSLRPVDPVTLHPAKDVEPPRSVDRVKLYQILVDFFNASELKDLCFELKIDYESLPGGGKSDKARELVAYAQRHGRTDDLVRACHKKRPHAPW